MGKLRDEIRKQQKRRARRISQGRGPTELIRLKATAIEQREFTEDRAATMLLIESTIFAVSLENDCVDHHVADAIRATLRASPTQTVGGSHLRTELEHVRQEREYDEDVWHAGLRVAYRSLTHHSKLRQGESTYLTFIGGFIESARTKNMARDTPL